MPALLSHRGGLLRQSPHRTDLQPLLGAGRPAHVKHLTALPPNNSAAPSDSPASSTRVLGFALLAAVREHAKFDRAAMQNSYAVSGAKFTLCATFPWGSCRATPKRRPSASVGVTAASAIVTISLFAR